MTDDAPAPPKRRGGRPKGSLNKIAGEQPYIPPLDRGEMPLAYMLRVMRDKEQPSERRDYMAKAAAPYCHPALKAIEVTGAGGGPMQYEVVLSFE